MNQTEYNLLLFFKKNPQKEFSTTDILTNIFPDEYKNIEEIFKNQFADKQMLNKAKRKKGQLHRKILYYLNNLVEEDILKISKQGNKGEKYFVLSLEEGEELIINKSKRKIIISKPSMPAMPIDGYEQKNIAARFESATWIDRLNSILLETTKFRNIKDLYNTINKCFSNINDVIGLNDFESVIQTNELNESLSFLRKINSECVDYGKKLSCIIDITNLKKEKTNKVIEFIKEYCDMHSENITLIFDVRSKELQEHSDFFEEVIDIFINSKIRIYIKNQDLYCAPYILGRIGPYCFDENEWLIYKKEFQKKSYGLACSQSTVVVDVNRFFRESNDIKQFRLFIKNIVKSLLSANSLQRRKSDEYFKNIVKLTFPYVKEFFTLSRNYIRFWNYGWKEPNLNQNYVIELIKSTKEEIDNFCVSEETIYKSCGMPTRFKVAFSCLFNGSKFKFSKGLFHKTEIKKLEDLYSKEIEELLGVKEEIFQAFDGGDRSRFYRTGKINSKDICREFNIILKTYKIPFFCYDFAKIKGADIKLTTFIG